jgi:hypothetical protein
MTRKKPVSKRISKKSSGSKKNCRKAAKLLPKKSSTAGIVLNKCKARKKRRK